MVTGSTEGSGREIQEGEGRVRLAQEQGIFEPTVRGSVKKTKAPKEPE